MLIQAVLKLGKSGLKDVFTWILAIAAFLLSLIFDVSAILIIAVVAVVAIVYRKIKRNDGGAE